MAETASPPRSETKTNWWQLSDAAARRASLAPLASVVALALVLNVWDLSLNGYGNTYYAAATRSMSRSLHNFFFASFDPGGFISVDKPPVFLWIEAVSVRLFGFSSWSLLLPAALAGTATVALLWVIVRRYFGPVAATLAALVLALTPIVVLISRQNQPEPFYVLALVGAAGCISRSLEGEAWWRWTAAAGLLVGVAFNTKMLAAWIPGPALALALVVGMEGAWWLAWRQWLPRLLLFGGVALAVSLSWMAVVEAWPSDSRPYVGGSTDNHVSGLILGYNGLDRVSSEPQAPNLGPSVASNVELNRDHNGPAALRMFNGENGGQIGWLLPLALIGGVVGLWRWRDRRVLRATLALWLAWLVLYGAVFSYMQGIYHPYYTYAMAPAIAVLVGAGTIAWSELARRHVAWAVAAAAAILLALWVQFEISSGHDGFYDWVRLPAAVVVIAGLAVFGAAMWRRHVTLLAGLVVVICGLSLLPAAWSSYEVRHPASGSISPRAGPREEEEPGVRNLRQIADEQEMSELAELLVAGRTEATVWDLVVDDAQDASILVLRQDLAVLPLGGFAGRDPTLTPAEFAELVAAGKVRYVWPSQSALRQGRAGTPQAVQPKGPGVDSVFAAVRAACEPATGVISPIRAFERDVVYDCEGRAAQLAAQ